MCVLGYTRVCVCVRFISAVQRGRQGRNGQKGGMKKEEVALLSKTFQFASVAEVNLLRQLPLPLFFSWLEM